jgi:tetratricopeptide (TPR) repeat protein
MKFCILLAAIAIMALAAGAQEDTASSLTSIGYDFMHQTKYAEALEAFDDALSINQSYVPAMAGKGCALDHLGNYSQSLEIYNRTIEIAPYYAKAWAGRGSALEDLNRSIESLDSINKSLETDPEYGIAWNERAWLYYEMGQHQYALEDADRGIELLQRALASTLDTKGMALLGLGRYNESMEYLNRAIQLAPSIAEPWYHMGDVLKAVGREDDAEQAYARARNLTLIWTGGEDI